MIFTFEEAKDLFNMFADDDLEDQADRQVTVIEGSGHSGRGKYAVYTEYANEGSLFLGKTDMVEVEE